MINGKSVSAVVLAAGSGTRFGNEKNKVYVEINNKPIILYSLDVFNNNQYIDEIVITIKESEKDIINNILSNQKYQKSIKIVVGGASRKQSVHNALLKINSDIVIIHDSARVAIKDEYINKCVEAMDEYKGVSIAVKSKDTIKITNDNDIIQTTTNRANTWIIQTPQCFDKQVLLDAHNKFDDDESITDDCMLLEKMNYEVKLIKGDYSNIKVTTPEDLDIIKQFIK